MVYTRGFNGKKMGKQVSLLHYHNDTGTGEEIAWMNSFYPVSYTHLDVYKRQVQKRPEKIYHRSADQRNGVHLHRTS